MARIHVIMRWVEPDKMLTASRAATAFLRDFPARPLGKQHLVVYSYTNAGDFAVWRTKGGVTVQQA